MGLSDIDARCFMEGYDKYECQGCTGCFVIAEGESCPGCPFCGSPNVECYFFPGEVGEGDVK